MKLLKILLLALLPVTIALQAKDAQSRNSEITESSAVVLPGKCVYIKGRSNYAIKKGNLTPADWQRRDKAIANALGLSYIKSCGYDKINHPLKVGQIYFIAANHSDDLVIIQQNLDGTFVLNHPVWDSHITDIYSY